MEGVVVFPAHLFSTPYRSVRARVVSFFMLGGGCVSFGYFINITVNIGKPPVPSSEKNRGCD